MGREIRYIKEFNQERSKSHVITNISRIILQAVNMYGKMTAASQKTGKG